MKPFETIENFVELNEKQIQLSKLPFNINFPWYFYKQTPRDNEQFCFFSHALITRSAEPKSNEMPFAGVPMSPHFDEFIEIFNLFCKKNKIKPKTILRANLNNTGYYPDKHSFVHRDHEFEHKNFIFYLNDFTNGSTFLFDKDHKIKKEIKAAKYKGVVFGGDLHAQGFCDVYERRLILVVTFI